MSSVVAPSSSPVTAPAASPATPPVAAPAPAAPAATLATAPASEPTAGDEITSALAAMRAARDKGAPAPAPAASAATAPAAAEPPAAEAAPAPATEPPKPEEPAGPDDRSWAAYRKQQKQFNEERTAFKREQAELARQMAEVKQNAQALRQIQEDAQRDPFAVLERLGVTRDDVARRVLGDGAPSPEEVQRREAAKREASSKAEQDRVAKLEAELAAIRNERALDGWKATARAELADPEFELLRGQPDAVDEVFKFADGYARRTGEALTPREAAERLQTELREYLGSLATSQAVRRLFLDAEAKATRSAQPTKPEPQGGTRQTPQGAQPSSTPTPPRTLTNNLAATPPPDPQALENLSEAEEIELALRLARAGR